jgi:diguanylate cyclase (GGDEF)-like protein
MVERRDFADDDETRLFIVMGFACAFVGIAHVLMLLFFVLASIWPLVFINAVSVVVYVVAFLSSRSQHYLPAGLLVSFEIIIYAFITMVLVGFDTYVYLYFILALILQFIVPYAKTAVRAVVGVVIFLFLLTSAFVHISFDPYIDINSAFLIPFSCFNVILSMAAVAIELSINNFVERRISNIMADRSAEFELQAMTDTLTGLSNRREAERYFAEISNESSGGKRSLAMLDIDDFKNVNDTYGHAVGDTALRELSHEISDALRQTDKIFRWGGEEFLVVLNGAVVSDALSIMDAFRKRLSTSASVAAKLGFNFTVTIGVAPLDLDDVDGSIAAADQQMYEGKRSGKNKVVAYS